MEEIPDIRHQLNQLAQLLMMDTPLPSVNTIHQSHAKFGDKCKDDSGDEWSNFEAQAAFLGPNIWDKGSGLEAELNLGDQYVDLDEFLNSSCIDPNRQDSVSPSKSEGGQSSSSSKSSEQEQEQDAAQENDDQSIKDEEMSEPPSPAASKDSDDSYHPPASNKRTRRSNVDYRKKRLADDDLKPLPMVKKSRKQFVPDDLKDDRYWARRRKNNMAAKRSRDARRAKENQIVVRASFLEQQNADLKTENEKLKSENKKLKAELAKYKK
ncbi:thyrotroph embryonic factor-like isoform X2 [Neocloeon triangulifer]|uniref:thyrotroph embryonic factor-like isoform X2 n=1 Tax=Neocloeon triangulifer TaxID=2078957 RepID=UPI00286EC2E5|nr:thyrotroph embryonic factor-like isoform X2 [Neocloeon triangulifer]